VLVELLVVLSPCAVETLVVSLLAQPVESMVVVEPVVMLVALPSLIWVLVELSDELRPPEVTYQPVAEDCEVGAAVALCPRRAIISFSA
jgi:hypothetical protein